MNESCHHTSWVCASRNGRPQAARGSPLAADAALCGAADNLAGSLLARVARFAGAAIRAEGAVCVNNGGGRDRVCDYVVEELMRVGGRMPGLIGSGIGGWRL